MATKQSVVITVAGQRLHVRSDRDEAYLQQLAAYVDELLEDLQRGARHATTQVLVLALLKLADELFEARRLTDDLRDELSERTERVIRLLDGAGPPDV